MIFKILIVDDDKDFANALKEVLEHEKRNFYIALSGNEALKILKEQNINLVFLDEQLPDISGLTLLEKISSEYLNTVSVMVTSSNAISQVVRAIQLGAYDYIIKPFKIEELEIIVKNALEKAELTLKIKELEDGAFLLKHPIFIGNSQKILKLKEQINKLKEHPFSSILLLGETGTGKGNIAKYIHWQYNKDISKFIHISCADIQSNLLETELFGYEKGAFTDAKATKKGLFELANDGTLFLDEIDSMPPETQAKLLYFLDNKKIRRVGGTKEIETNVRLIAATNADLSILVQEKEFRKDLFFRLNMISMQLPPLREKKEDIKPLTKYFIELFNRTFNKSINNITDGALNKLKSYSWPGNVRELKNVIEHAMIFCNGNVITKEDITLTKFVTPTNNKYSFPFNDDDLLSLKEQELLYIKHVLNVKNEHKSNTAKTLGITLTTLLSKLK